VKQKKFSYIAAAKSLQSCLTLCDPIDGLLSGSSVPGILQARTLESVAIFFSNALKWKVKSESEVAQSCLTLSDLTDCSLPGSSVHGIFQARVLEWGAIAFSAYVASKHINLNNYFENMFVNICLNIYVFYYWKFCDAQKWVFIIIKRNFYENSEMQIQYFYQKGYCGRVYNKMLSTAGKDS